MLCIIRAEYIIVSNGQHIKFLLLQMTPILKPYIFKLYKIDVLTICTALLILLFQILYAYLFSTIIIVNLFLVQLVNTITV